MTRVGIAALVLVGCGRGASPDVKPRAIDARAIDAPMPSTELAILDAAVGSAAPRPPNNPIAIARVLFDDVLCLDAWCGKIGLDSRTDVSEADRAFVFTNGCIWREGILACTDGMKPATLAGSQRDVDYVVQDDSVRWFSPTQDHSEIALAPITGLPSKIVQVSVGFRAGCALGGDGTVRCWSDPEKPAVTIKTPPKVVDVMVQDLFTICVRTAPGDVYCTPPYVMPDELACSSTKNECGLAGIEEPVMRKPFAPITLLQRPLVKVALPEPALSLVRDETWLFIAAMDSLKFQPDDSFGGCVLGAHGVACLAPCKTAWGVYRVTGPAHVNAFARDDQAGYIIDDAQKLWTFESACKGTVEAKPVVIGPVRSLVSPPLRIQSGPQSMNTTRCAITVDGGITCWARERGRPALPSFDPRGLPHP